MGEPCLTCASDLAKWILWTDVYTPDPDACQYVSHKPDWRVLERGFFRRWPGDTRQPSQESTVVCLQCVSVWRSDIGIDQIKDFSG